MSAKAQMFVPKGMKRDYSASKADPSFAYENHNIRITAMDGSTLLSITNEKGNKKVTMDPSSFNVLHVRISYDSTLDQTDVIATLDRNTQYLFPFQIYWKDLEQVTGTMLHANSKLGTFTISGKREIERVEIVEETNRMGVDGLKISYTEDADNINMFPGQYIGYCTLNKYLVLFFHIPPKSGVNEENRDYIARLEEVNGKWIYKILYVGDLNLSPENPIETLGLYETAEIQKVYWTDSRNQPRVINIVGEQRDIVDSTQFDFASNIPNGVSLGVTQEQGGAGSFSAGTIQYAVSFYKRYGQETGLVKVSPLQYIGFKDRGAAADELVSSTFTISVTFGDAYKLYDFARVYSIHRTSLDATPIVKTVGDIPVKTVGDGILIDTGSVGYNVDPTMLLYLGSTEILAKTLEQKDGTLFLGGYTIEEELISSELKRELHDPAFISFEYSNRNLIKKDSSGELYPYKNQLSMPEDEITTLKSRDWYRFGVQFQYPSGKWSDVVYIGDKRCSLIPLHTISGGEESLKLARGVVTIPGEISTKLAKSFVAARGVIVFPSASEREVLYQGVLCPTVYNTRDRSGNSPFAQSSWFFRENPAGSSTAVDPPQSTFEEFEVAKGVEMRHNRALKSGEPSNVFEGAVQASYGGEIQGLWATGYDPGDPYTTTSASAFHRDYPNAFFVDQSTVTFHSPDIEFGNEKEIAQNSKLRLRIIGTVPLNMMSTFSTINMETLGQNGKPASVNLINYSGLLRGGRLTTVMPKWRDSMVSKETTEADFLIYPWHRKGSLNNFPTPTEGEKRTATFKSKVYSNLRVARYTRYFTYLSAVWDANGTPIKDDEFGYETSVVEIEKYTGITGVQIFDSTEQTMLRLEEPLNSNLELGGLNYYGNIDTTFADFGSPLNKEEPLEKTSYPIAIEVDDPSTSLSKKILLYLNFPGQPEGVLSNYWLSTPRYRYGQDPIPMAYKSSPHAVFSLNYTTSHQQRILPVIGRNKELRPMIGDIKDSFPFWAKKPLKGLAWVSYEELPDSPILGDSSPYLYLAELYREISPETLFGGRGEDALENNKWIVAGDSVKIEPSQPIKILYTQGDTYYQRYDCLKTYPYGKDDLNNIVEIVSFMCETRINIDGRYDKNRGQSNNTSMTPLNFNLLNPNYSQKNNFFTYNFVDSEQTSSKNFRNSVVWSKTKTFGEEIDSWTNLTLLSSLDFDGDKGEIEAIRKLSNELYCFQPLGISRILYNSRAQMATIDGGAGTLPVELTNTGKVDGKVYITKGVGSSNKWSIITTPSGMYFIDDLTNSLQLLSPNGISDLSDKLAFREWVSSVSSTAGWNPESFDNVVSFYDSTNSDVYFITKDSGTTVSYSELLGQFTSFFDYQLTPLMFPLNGKFFSLKDHNLWEQNAGEYNSFFGRKRPYSIEVICNMDEPVDKIFNTVEWRATIKENGLDSTKTFSNIRVTTDGEYQDTGDVSISNNVNSPRGGMLRDGDVSLRRKFRMWRIPVPRDNSPQGKGRDRMRGPWAKIRLSQDEPEDEKMELHDIIVHFFE